MARTTEQVLFFVACVQRAQQEILTDIKSDRVPLNVTCFGDLHDYVDANEYGGLCDDDVIDVGNRLFPERTDDTIKTQAFMDVCEEVQCHLNNWISNGSMFNAYAAAQKAN